MQENKKKDEFIKNLAVEGLEEKNRKLYKNIEKKHKINEIFDIIDKNPKLLYKLNISQLKKIYYLYDKEIEKMKKSIKN